MIELAGVVEVILSGVDVLGGPKLATIFFALSMVTVKGFVDPEASPDHPIKADELLGVAVKITFWLIAKFDESKPFEVSIPKGEDITAPAPPPGRR